MGGGFQFIDIILFALVAAFLILRLRSVLGRRDGHQGPAQDPFRQPPAKEKAEADVVRLPERGEPASLPLAQDHAPGSLQAGLTQIKIADPRFNDDEFLSGAGVAFEMILTAYVAGDTNALKPLLSPEVFANFSRSIEERGAAGEVLETTLVGLQKASVEEAYMAGRMAHVTVRFVSEQVTVTRNAAGEIVEGDPDRVTTVTDLWTFARDTRSPDPNWTLVATGTVD
ncbi:MAG TPA: Tim44/TimA family putative adaptor protein [Rhodospirillales bacterium]|nr:Tim44/TimA family putative adaptor protein [Rhodospirillales bacterium]